MTLGKSRQDALSSIVLLVLLSILSYGLLTPWLGFYWDDWPTFWVARSLGPSGLVGYMQCDRPLVGWLYSVLLPRLGGSPFVWHLFALGSRILMVLAVWLGLRGLWPARRFEVTAVSLLFATYPGFTQQPVAFTYGSSQIMFLLTYLSLAAMIWSFRLPRWRWPLTLLAVALQVTGLAVTEYLAGLELVRPVLMWLILSETVSGKRRLSRQVLLAWVPYLMAVLLVLGWRLFLFESGREATDQTRFLQEFLSAPLGAISMRLQKAFSDLIESGLIAWVQTLLLPPNSLFTSRTGLAGWGLFLLSGSLAVWFFHRQARSQVETAAVELQTAMAEWGGEAVLLGGFMMLVGGIPFWFAGRQVHLFTVFDRYTLPLMLGACIFLAGAIEWLVRHRRGQAVLIGLLVGLNVAFHFRVTSLYQQDWQHQKEFFRQLSWRAPGLEPGTAMLVVEPPTMFNSDYAFGVPMNLVYAPGHSSTNLDYWAFVLPKQYRTEVPDLVPGTPLSRRLRSLAFSGSTSRSLVVWHQLPYCLRVLDLSQQHLPGLPEMARSSLPISASSVIGGRVEPRPQPLSQLFELEAKDCWCYYFQKAELARQQGDWLKVAQLADEARERQLQPAAAAEWLPFIEGFIRVGRYIEAREKALAALKAEPLLREELSSVLARISSNNSSVPDPAQKTFISELRAALLASSN